MDAQPMPLTFKVVIRCADYAASRAFYADVLGLPVLQQWDGPAGTGGILALGDRGSGGTLEIYQMTPEDRRYNESFSRPFTNDKVDMQLGTASFEQWIERLTDRWPYEGPVTMPWSERRLQLRDPDNLLVAICETAASAV
ncbi:MAG: VOC family protein [Chloroflexi bacterium]|nr:VOC family protein [Chloroflexota bacterium]